MANSSCCPGGALSFKKLPSGYSVSDQLTFITNSIQERFPSGQIALIGHSLGGVLALDAGAGTGALAHEARKIEPEARVTMLDIAGSMSRLTSHTDGSKLRASVLQLPFSDDSFDLVVSGWVILF